MDFDTLINSEKPTLVEFFATWCPHCRRMMPIVAEIGELLEGQLQIVQLDIDENSEAADRLGVANIPTFLVYRNGKELWRHTGEMDAEVLLNHIKECM